MARIIRKLIFPLTLLLGLLVWPLRIRARKNALKKDGWIELQLEGEVFEHRPPPRFPPFVRRLLKQEETPRVVLSRLRHFTEHFIKDPHAKGILVRVGLLQGGWAAADEIRGLLQRIKDSGREVFVHAMNNVGNKEMLIASASTKFLMTPTGTLASTGAAMPGLFLKNVLDKAGVTMEVFSKGRFKSAPDQFTRTDRSEPDQLQGKALVDEMDEVLIKSVMNGRIIDRVAAEKLIDDAPIVGAGAHEAGYCDALARDEDLPALIQAAQNKEESPNLLGAGSYLGLHDRPSPTLKRRKKIGIVEVHGAIVDRAPSQALPVADRMAVERAVVSDLRAALADKNIGAVVVHINSRGGSVTASDAIYSAMKRLDQEKPVIACFGDVSASGGYYVACGARKIVCSPLTITGSIGVFAMQPAWYKLADMFGVGRDVIKNRKNASLYNPWANMNDEERARIMRNVESMYDSFVSLVAQARDMTEDNVNEVAEGRVWTGRAAHEKGLVDGLGGMEEALSLARENADVSLDQNPVIVRARGLAPRPKPYDPSAKAAIASILLNGTPEGAAVIEMLNMLSTTQSATPNATPNGMSFWAYSPVGFG